MALSATFSCAKPKPGDDSATDAIHSVAADDHFELNPVHRQEVEKNPLLELASNDEDIGSDREAKEDPFEPASDTGNEISRRRRACERLVREREYRQCRQAEQQLDANFSDVFPMMDAPSVPTRLSC